MLFLGPQLSLVALLAVATSVLGQPGRHASRSVTDDIQVTSPDLLGREADSSVEMLSRRAYKIALPIGKSSLKNLWTVTKAHGPKAGLMYALSSKVRLAYKAEHVTWKNQQTIMRSKWRNHGANVPPANQQKGRKVVGKIRKVLKIKPRHRRSLLARQASAPLSRRSPLGGVITGLKTAGRYVKDTAKITYKHGIGAGTTFAKSATARQNYRKGGFHVMMDLKKGNTVVYKTNGMKITADGGFGLKSVDQIDSQLADLKRMYKQGGIHRRSPLGAEVRLVAPVAGMMQKRAPLADYYGAQELERLAKIRWGGGPKPESKAYQVPDVPKLRSHWGWQGYPSRPSINGPVTRVPRPVEIIGPTKPTAVKPQVAPQPVQTPDKVPSSTPIESRAVITTTENSTEHVLQKRCGALKACWEEVGKMFRGGREPGFQQQEPSKASQGLSRHVGAPRVQKMSADQHSPSYDAFTDKSPQRTKGRIAWQGERLTKDNIPRQIKLRVPRPVAQAWLGEP